MNSYVLWGVGSLFGVLAFEFPGGSAGFGVGLFLWAVLMVSFFIKNYDESEERRKVRVGVKRK